MKAIKYCLLFVFVYGFIFKSNGQIDVSKLDTLFSKGEYQKCAKKGIALTEKDKYKKEPLPYLYVSMSLFEISKEPNLKFKYPKAFKDAMKYAYKYRKKDKQLEKIGEYEDYIIELKESANRKAQQHYKREDFRKSASYYKQIFRFDPNAYFMQLWQGISEIKAKNIGEGERNLFAAMEYIDENYELDKVDATIAAAGMREYANYMESRGDRSAASRGEQLAAKFEKGHQPKRIAQKQSKSENQKKTTVVSNKESAPEVAKETVTNEGKRKPKVMNFLNGSEEEIPSLLTMNQLEESDTQDETTEVTSYPKEISLVLGREVYLDNLWWVYEPAISFEFKYSKANYSFMWDYSLSYFKANPKEDIFYYLIGQDVVGTVEYTDLQVAKLGWGTRKILRVSDELNFHIGFLMDIYYVDYSVEDINPSKILTESKTDFKAGLSPFIGVNYFLSNNYGIRLQSQYHFYGSMSTDDGTTTAVRSEKLNHYYSTNLGVFYQFGK